MALQRVQVQFPLVPLGIIGISSGSGSNPRNSIESTMTKRLKPGQRVRMICRVCGSGAYVDRDDIRRDNDDPQKIYVTLKCSDNLCGHSHVIEGRLLLRSRSGVPPVTPLGDT